MTGTPHDEGSLPWERVHAWLLSLHAPSYRRRWGRDARELFREWVASGTTDQVRRDRGRAAVEEAFRTLLRSWSDLLRTPWMKMMMTGGEMMETMIAGFRGAFRGIRRRPMQSLVVVATLSLAIGVNAALFGAVEVLLLRQLPYRNAEEIVAVKGGSVVGFGAGGGFQIDRDFLEIPEVSSASFFSEGGAASLTGGTGNDRVTVTQVAPNFFDVVGAEMALGPGLPVEEDGNQTAIISHGVWVRLFGSDPSVLDRELVLNGRAYPIVGVTRPEVAYPGDTEVWLSYPIVGELYANAMGADVVARMREGTTADLLDRRLEGRYSAQQAEYEEEGRFWPLPDAVPFRENLVDGVQRPLMILMGSALMVLLLGALNLASVWLNQIVEREEELRVRSALGASRRRLLGQLMTETVALSLLGGLTAIGVAILASDVVARRLPPSIPGASELGVGPSVAFAAIGASLLVGLIFGGLAASRGTGTERTAGAAKGVGRGEIRFQRGLIVIQGAMALVLVVGAGMLVRSFQKVAAVPLGFDPAGQITMQLTIPEAEAETKEAVDLYHRNLSDRLMAIPGVSSVGWTNALPLTSGILGAGRFRREGDEGSEPVTATFMIASADYFGSAGIPILQGRDLPAEATVSDIVISRTMAEELFPEGGAVGSIIETANYSNGVQTWVPRRVHGVVESVRHAGHRNDARNSIYQAADLYTLRAIGLVVRTDGNPSRIADAVRQATLEENPRIIPDNLRTMRQAADQYLETDRTMAQVSSGFSLAGLLLAALGLYGVMAQQLNRRQREMGIRLALGARPGSLVRRAVGEGVVIGVFAILLGLPGVWFGARQLQTRLFEMQAMDPASIAGGALFVLTMTLVAAWIPARRIQKLDPAASLSAE